MRSAIFCLVLALSSASRVAPAARVRQAGALLKATIAYSCAPWDGTAFTTTVPAAALAGGSKDAVISISIWQAPAFKDTVSFHFPDRDMKTGSAFYFDGKAPGVELSGRVTFQRVVADSLVRGDFDLVSASGVYYRARFEAAWSQLRALCG